MASSVGAVAVTDYFDAALVSDDRFVDASRSGENERLLRFVRAILQANWSDTQAVRTLLSHLPEHGLWHGVIVLRSGILVQIIYLEDMNRGICTAGTWLNDPVERIRFSLPEPHHHADRCRAEFLVDNGIA